jgi:hypothetical protein
VWTEILCKRDGDLLPYSPQNLKKKKLSQGKWRFFGFEIWTLRMADAEGSLVRTIQMLWTMPVMDNMDFVCVEGP